MNAAVDYTAPVFKSVEDYLGEIDYTIPIDYEPSDFALSFVAFIKLVNGGQGEENETPLVHLYMLDAMVSGHKRIANLCCRGSAKTTIFGEYMILYLAVYGKLPGFGSINLILYVSDSIENGVKNMRKNLEYRYENSEFLQQYIPKVKFTDVRWEFRNADGKILIVKGYGAQTGVRGAKELGTRPQMAILDDLVSDEDARSATVIAAIEATVHKALKFALHPSKYMMVWSGTPFNARDPLYKAVESGAWYVNVYPVCEHFPCSEDDFVSAWPDRFTYEYVKDMYDDAVASGKVDTFNQELMLRIMSAEERVIDDSDILWYSMEPLVRNRSQFNVYITTDFATSAKESSDYSVISVWAYNSKGQWFWIDGICKRQTMNKNIDDLFRLAQKWNPQSVGIEVSGQQVAFLQWIMAEMMERNIWFTLASDKNSGEPGIRPNTNKMERFNVVQSWFPAHRMFFPVEKKRSPELMEAMDELRLIAHSGIKSKHDDFIDTVSMLGSMNPWKPSEDAPMSEETRGGVNFWEFDEPPIEATSYSSYIV